ncbi:exodeoxyribonuclease VII large subunit [Lentibacter algarum]|uniref:exodeoxyribonuclease VII large subunit n=1 Tax=Lentibacter algarum TaxID=576131 RepID=UPI001C079057|nr:exodeoxyribonuclease VII large subunit [Lentibacter algarum]MBU2981835.1 exodeoxyribonuclease VII large subunit [Lentibacter algarum]
MSDLIDDPEEGANAPEFSVSDISGAIKRLIEGEFAHVRIRGEVGRVSRPRSGHLYLDLKDDKAVINGIIWKGVASRLQVQPEEGMEVVAVGRLTTFAGQSRYQIIIEEIRPAGVGALMAMLEKRKQMLAAEGLFAPELKKPIPYLPQIIGVVTSPSGAVIRDILHRLRDRFPRKVLVWPVAVQGDKSAGEVARAIEGFNAMSQGGAMPRPDLLIVARGGGSVEDLWSFNEEIVARAVAASDIPLISAVGHETDTTLIDFVSDKRAPTPTAAAELAVPVRLELMAWVNEQGARMSTALTGNVERRGQRLRDLARAIPRPESLVEPARQRMDRAAERLPAALRHGVQTRQVTLSEVTGSLRPSILTRAVSGERQRLTGLSARMNLQALQADMQRKQTDLTRLTKRISDTGRAQLRSLTERLEATDRLRETLSYKATLGRGYAVVRGESGVVTTKKAAAKAGALEIEFADGLMALGEGGEAAAKAKPKPKPTKPTDQGSLF